ncbi:MAG: hypothetical protein QOD42_2766 [Sphingomonadales bacterium]|jgi:hypothetical protein|nr:hypothetical protein [Sphingomonadales bacterium]
MKARCLVALAIAMLAPSGGAASARGNIQEVTPGTALPDAAREDARFRHVARSVHEALLIGPCQPDPAPRRAAWRAGENAEVRAFEERIGPGPPRFHWEVARSDVEHRRDSGDLGCSDEADSRLAASHAGMARDRVRLGLQELERMAPGLAALPASAAAPPLPDGAAFRLLVRRLVEHLQPFCVLTTAADNDRIMAPAKAELARFRQRLEGTPYALDFDLAEADGLYERSITVAECGVLGDDPAAAVSRDALDEARRQIAGIAAAAGL